jgi:hypothetical protein
MCRADRLDELTVVEDAGNVREEVDPRSPDADGKRGRGLVRIDVEWSGRRRRDDRHSP